MKCWGWIIAPLVMQGCVALNIPLGYVVTVGVHEGAHAAVAKYNGSESIQVDLLPKWKEGRLLFGETIATHKPWSDREEDLFLAVGPASTALLHIGLRETLKAGLVPKVFQPPVAWISLCAELSTIYQSGIGLMGKGDLQDLDAISLSLLGLTFGYDLFDYLVDGDMKWRVLIGQKYYECDFGIVMTPTMFGIKLEW